MIDFLLSWENKLRGLCEKYVPMPKDTPSVSELLSSYPECYYCHKDFSEINIAKFGPPVRV